MNIISLELKNFKTYKHLVYNCNEKFNVIIGANNIGKSTILEAILLWKSCYDLFIQEKNHKKFYVGYNNRYLLFSDLFFLRITKDSDIFFGNAKSLEIGVKIRIEDEVFFLNFTIQKPDTIKNSYLKVSYSNNDDFLNYTDTIVKRGHTLFDCIFIYQTKPISYIDREEPFYNEGQLYKKISLGKSHEVIRNKILKTQKSNYKSVVERFEVLEQHLLNIYGRKYSIRLKNKSITSDEYVIITIKDDKDVECELNLMGSGFLQVLDIFSTLEFINKDQKCLNIILIDEPDSHIHSNLQYNLINELKKLIVPQCFLISHNEKLIKLIPDGELFLITDKTKILKELNYTPFDAYIDVEHELAQKMLDLNVNQDAKYFVLSEDENLNNIKSIFRINGFPHEHTEFISYYGCDTIGAAIAIGKFIKSKNTQAKIIIHRDRDYLDDNEIQEIIVKISKHNFSYYITKGVDVESEFVNDSHISSLYPEVDVGVIRQIIDEATQETKDDSIDRLLKFYAKRNLSGVKYLAMYDKDIVRYRYGKKVLNLVKAKLQAVTKANVDLARESEFLKFPFLEEILEK